MRSLSIALLVIVLWAGPSLAAEVNLHKHSVEEVKSACEKSGGSFSQESRGYGCGTDCKGAAGTDCTVFCDAHQMCTAQVTGSRKPRTIADALQAKGRH